MRCAVSRETMRFKDMPQFDGRDSLGIAVGWHLPIVVISSLDTRVHSRPQVLHPRYTGEEEGQTPAFHQVRGINFLSSLSRGGRRWCSIFATGRKGGTVAQLHMGGVGGPASQVLKIDRGDGRENSTGRPDLCTKVHAISESRAAALRAWPWG